MNTNIDATERGTSAWIGKLEEAVVTGACFGRSDFESEDLRAAHLTNIDLRGCRDTKIRGQHECGTDVNGDFQPLALHMRAAAKVCQCDRPAKQY